MLQNSNKENVQKRICLKVWWPFISPWQKHLPEKDPRNASPRSPCGPAELQGWAGTAASASTFLQVCFAMWAATSKASADELDLLCGTVPKAVLTCRNQDFPPVFSSVPAAWCTIINIAGSLLLQQSKCSTVTLCSFLVPMLGVFFGFHFLYQWSWKQGVTANKKGHT